VKPGFSYNKDMDYKAKTIGGQGKKNVFPFSQNAWCNESREKKFPEVKSKVPDWGLQSTMAL
jgi:hypothetical protein